MRRGAGGRGVYPQRRLPHQRGGPGIHCGHAQRHQPVFQAAGPPDPPHPGRIYHRRRAHRLLPPGPAGAAGHELQGGGKGGGALPGAGGGVPPGPGHPRGRHRPGAAHRGAHVVQRRLCGPHRPG